MVTEVALAVKMGTVDAGIIWDALGGFAPDDAEVVRIPLARNVIGVVAATVLASSRNPDAANAFLDCLTSDKGKAILKAKGHTVEKPAETLLVHVGGTMRPAMEEICALFEKEAGVKVELNYNDSGALMTVIQTTGKGDVCVVHDPFAAALDRKGLVDRIFTVASLTPTIVVKKGNPKKIAALKDLTRDGVRVALTDAEYSTGGHVVGVVFRKAGIAEAMEKKEIVRARSGGEVANAVKLGTVDAAIVWNAVAFERRDSLDAIPIDPVTSATYGVIDMSSIRVTLMTLKASRAPGAARALADFAMSDRGRAVFEKKGFSPAAIAPPATPPTDTPGAP
jgi:molybdate transport system substrate-binding protein